MDMSKLAMTMLEWELAQAKADELRAVIEAEVLALGESVTVGKVKATYYGPKVTRDWQGAAVSSELVDPERYKLLLEEFTTLRESVRWRELAEALGWVEEAVDIVGKSDPRVTVVSKS